MNDDNRHNRMAGEENESRLLTPRTKAFGLRVLRLFDSLPHKPAAQVVGKQLLRSALSVGANYRSACRARSKAEFAAKMGIVLEEVDESKYWMEILVDGSLMKKQQLAALIQEATEIAAMVIASINTARRAKPG